MRLLFMLFAAVAGLLLISSADVSHAMPGMSGGAKSGQAAQAPAENPGIAGKVVETMNSGGYTYVLLEDEGKKTWVAAPQMKVKVGDNLVFSPGDTMQNYESKSLKRKFGSIVFSPGPLTLPGTKADRKAKGSSGPAGTKIKVEKAKGKDAYTVEDVYKNASKLNNKKVTVRGKVVKVSTAIMGVNWVHVQDGTGDLSKGTGNLVVTTDALPTVGSVVTITGVMAKDKDFGYGYKYDAIVEKATVK